MLCCATRTAPNIVFFFFFFLYTDRYCVRVSIHAVATNLKKIMARRRRRWPWLSVPLFLRMCLNTSRIYLRTTYHPLTSVLLCIILYIHSGHNYPLLRLLRRKVVTTAATVYAVAAAERDGHCFVISTCLSTFTYLWFFYATMAAVMYLPMCMYTFYKRLRSYYY